MQLEEIHDETAIDPWFLAQIEQIVGTERQLGGRSLASLVGRGAALHQADGLFRSAAGQAARHQPSTRCARRDMQWACGRSTSASTPALPSSRRRPRTSTRTYDEECEAEPTDATQDHGAGRWAQSHRSRHRVRLLLRARGAGDARGRLRDHHGQLQSGDRVDRLRHQRPLVLRAGDAGRRARDRRQGKTRSA